MYQGYPRYLAGKPKGENSIVGKRIRA
jgi:hypothetical protein